MALATDTKVMTAHVPLPLAQRVDALAQQFDRSRGWIMKQALSAWVDQEEERSRMTQQAMADVDAGRLVEHSVVRTWAEGLSSPAGDPQAPR